MTTSTSPWTRTRRRSSTTPSRMNRDGVVDERLLVLVHGDVDVVIGESEVAEDLSRTLLDREQGDDVAQQRVATRRQHRSDLGGQPGLVDEPLVEQRRDVHGLTGVRGEQAVDPRGGTGVVQRTFERQSN